MTRSYMVRMSILIVSSVSLLLVAVGCGDDGNPAGPGDGGGDAAFRDFSLTLRGMDPHVGRLLVLTVAGGTSGKNARTGGVEARFVLDPLPAAEYGLFVPDGVPEGTFDLDFYADLNGSGSYDAPPIDHAWRIALPASGNVAEEFTHNTTFTDIGATPPVEGGDFTLDLSGLDPHVGQLFELRVIETESGATVGQYRLGAVPAAAMTITIPGIIADGMEYSVDFYADLNGSGGYDAPPVDHAWRLAGAGTSSGLVLSFSHSTAFTDIGFTEGGGPIEETPVATFTEIRDEILTPSCVDAGCHPGGGAPMSLASGSAYGNLVDVASAYGIDRVEPGNSAASALYLKVAGDASTGSRMPLGRAALSTDDIDRIAAWIDAGAKND